ncbi:Hint domain-containing protein [Gymnodinialimonas ceratoperidinii]|uniref:Hint domain-containing protein n=1 Tax=Gymnodinialimonas ceratoperidinii TaxID=2856823 RepID=A0A8F6YBI4_9RHOB|nr:Hint domain-containing protein [Gymnodinialimonas ceratoperidinii]QXT40131.1 Hint domain-containing protein [Gymnodinialimonas ceratoperidinii]
MSWQAIWSEGRAYRVPPVACDTPLRAMTLLLELIGPKKPTPPRGRSVARDIPLRLWQGAREGAGAICLYLMPDGALRLLHGEIDLRTEPGTLRAGETLSLRYIACSEGRSDLLEVTNHDQDRVQVQRSGLQQQATLADALPRDPRFLTVAHVAAVASSAIAANALPGIESGAMVATAEGTRPVDALRPGDRLLDDTGSAHPLRWIEARPRLCLGRAAPMCLRAPYFGLVRDLVVTPQTRLLQTGPMVDYLCGTEAVLATAADLATGRAVTRDRSKPMRMFYHMMLDDPACIRVENSPIETVHLGDVLALGDQEISKAASPVAADTTPSLPLLDRAAARALVTAHGKAA